MKEVRGLLLLVFALFAASAWAQKTYVVSGKVIDSATRQPIEFATAQLLRPNNTMANGMSTDNAGGFTLKTTAAGKYTVKVSYVSYKTATREVTFSEKNDTIRLGTLELEPSAQALGEAVVSATQARVEQKEDTTVYNASAYRTPVGSTLEALVEQLPGVEVSDDGTITWNGKTVSEFLINGKDFFKGDTKIAMKNLPVELVSKLKAYDKKSDYTEQTGIDDGEETTVLDITTKKKLDASWVNNVDLGYGTKDRYTGRLFSTRFTERSRVSLYGSANNTSDRGFGGWRGGWGGGLTATKSAGADFYWENDKEKRDAGRLELGGNVRYSYSGTDSQSKSNSENFLTAGQGSSFANSFNRSGSGTTNVNGAFRLEWHPDTLTMLMFRPSFSHSSSHNDGSSQSATFNADPYEIDGIDSPLDSMLLDDDALPSALRDIAVNRNVRTTLGESKSNSFDASLMLVRRLNSEGRNVSMRASAGYSKSTSRSFSDSKITYFQQDAERPVDWINQFSDNPSMNWNASVRAGYSEPIAKNWHLQFNYQFSYRYSDSDRSLYYLNSLIDSTLLQSNPELAYRADNLLWSDVLTAALGTTPTDADLLMLLRDADNSQYATYKYFTHRASVGIRYNTKKIRFNAGLDFVPQKTVLAYNRPSQIDTTVTRHVFNVSPQVRLRYRFSDTGQLDIRYRGSASEPSMTDLLDIVDDSDPLNITRGNPGLKPSWENSLRVFFNNYITEKQQGMMAGLFVTQESNSISNAVEYNEETGVRTVHPENINGNWNARGNFMFNTGFGPDKTWTFSTFTNLGYKNDVGYVTNDNINQKSTTRSLNVGENLNLAYRTSWFDVGLRGNVNYQHARNSLQTNANQDTWNFSYGLNGNVNLPWNMSISTDIRMNSRRGYSDNSMNTNELIWNAQIAQSFLKDNTATISLQFYDILQKQSNISRTINAQLRQDTWTNAINSYCMLHFIYRLNIFSGVKGGDRQDRDGRRRGPGRAPAMRMMPMMAPARM